MFSCLKKSSTKVLVELIELLDIISSSKYPSLRDSVHNVNSNIIVKTKEQVIWAYSYYIALTIVVYKLGKRKKTCLYSLVFGCIDVM